MACHTSMLKLYHKSQFTPLTQYSQVQDNKRKLRAKSLKELTKSNKLNKLSPYPINNIDNQIS